MSQIENGRKYIIRGYLVPIFDEKKQGPVFIKVLERNELRRKWEEFITDLRSVIEEVNKNIKGISEEEKIKLFANLVTLIYKAPMIMPPFLRGINPVIETPGYLLLIRFLLPKVFDINFPLNLYEYKEEEIKDRNLRYFNELVHLAHELIEKYIPTLKNIVMEESKIRLIRELFFETPADTRPLLNTSSLVVHLLATSALAWAMAKKDGIDEKELCILRLAALFHDIGKPFNWERHVLESVNIFRKIFQGILSQSILDKVSDLIRQHHSGGATGLVRYLIEADRIASNIDRLANYVSEALNKIPGIDENVKNIIKDWVEGRRGWETFNELIKEMKSFEKVKELYEEIIRKSLEVPIEKVEEKEEITGISLMKIDTRKIQKYVFGGLRIPEVAGGSRIIDLLIMYDIPSKLLLNDFPAENILYTAGGNIVLLIPDNEYARLRDLFKEIFSSETYRQIDYMIAKTTLKINIVETLEDLERRLSIGKIMENLQNEKSLEVSPIAYLCDSCREYPAAIIDRVGEDEDRLCIYCFAKRQFGRLFTFKSKLKALRKSRLWKLLSKYVMEYIAGHSPEKLKLLEERRVREFGEYRDLAVIKSDGNLMGYFMAQSRSLTDLLERSYRVDLALKQGYSFALSMIENELRSVFENELKAKEWIERIYLGTIFMGGDDVFIIMPAWLSIPFSLILAETFHKELGYHDELSISPTLTIGISSGKPKAPIWSLVETAASLLDYGKTRGGRRSGTGGALAFLVSKSLVFTSESARSFLMRSVEDRLSSMPYVLKGKPNIYFILAKIFEKDGKQITTYEDKINFIREIIKELAKEFIGGEISRLKSIRRHMLRVLNMTTNGEKVVILNGVMFALREFRRRGEEDPTSKYYKMLIDMIPEVSDPEIERIKLPIIDLIMLIDLMKGGVV